MAFYCPDCRKEHEGLPDLGMDHPDSYLEVPKEEREERTTYTTDRCIISYEGTGGGRAWTDCHVHGGGDTGASCTSDADCKRARPCRGAPAGTCTEYCSTADSSTCPSPLTCQPLDQSGVVVDGIDWGYCG